MKELPLRLRVVRSMPLTLLLYLIEWKLLGEFLDECVKADDAPLHSMLEKIECGKKEIIDKFYSSRFLCVAFTWDSTERAKKTEDKGNFWRRRYWDIGDLEKNGIDNISISKRIKAINYSH